MERQSPPAPSDPDAYPVVVWMTGRLRDRGLSPSPMLVWLFANAALLQAGSKNPELVTTESLFISAFQFGMWGIGQSTEEQALRRYVDTLMPYGDQIAASAKDLFEEYNKPEEAVTAPARQGSRNVELALDMACEVTLFEETPTIVSVARFLYVFPPKGSVADLLIQDLGVSLASLRRALEGTGRPLEAPRPDAQPPAAGAGFATDQEVVLPDAAPKLNDRVSTHTDEPALFDQLGRDPFAEVLARRIREARREGPASFVVHLHGPWGSGKSTLLNFLEAKLHEGPEAWLIVRFDAWRDQRLQPPWWSLISAVYRTAKRGNLWLRARWLGWRIRADFVPFIAVLLCAIGLLLLVLWVGTPTDAPNGENQAAVAEEQFATWLDRLFKLAAAAITIFGAIVWWSRSLAMGSQRAAQAYADLKTDPYRPIAGLFKKLVTAIPRPVAIFIEDLDRCEEKYVVELLEGIQTLMRGAPVTYVVAADRKWICSSFEQHYAGFSPPIGEGGRPLGYLFLDKIFQMSVAMPQPGDEVQAAYWKGLLDPGAGDPRAAQAKIAEAIKRADEQVLGLTRQEDLQAVVAAAERTGDETRIQAARAAAAKQIASEEAAVHTEHRLQPFVPLLEPNPRSMKRLVNTYGMHQTTLFLAGRTASPESLARWTILELRWPLLADFLASRPGFLDRLDAPLTATEVPRVPQQIRELFGDELVLAVVGRRDDKGALDAEALRSILGASHGER